MTRKTYRIVGAGVALALGLFAIGRTVMAKGIEEPAYTASAIADRVELRDYAPRIVAETIVAAEMGPAGNEGFRRLAGYIFGGNRGGRKIAMTAPVDQQPVRIAMTAPVEQRAEPGAGERYRVAFTMPRGYTLGTLPIPNDDRVTLRQLPGERVAAIRFSGRWTASSVAEKTEALMAALARVGLRPAGEPVFARYNPPWTLPWLRRNEIIVPIAANPPAVAADSQ